MKFDRVALIAATETALAQHRTDWDAKREEKRATYAAQLDEFVEESGPQWAAALPALRKKINKRQPITLDDLPHGLDRWRNRQILTWGERPPALSEDYEAPADLSALLVVLNAVTDEIVTTSALSDLGITRRGMANAVHQMKPGTAHA